MIIPLYNEEDNIAALHEKISEAMTRLNRSYEIILINDGSDDNTGERIDALADKDEHVVAVTFRRNFGQTAAMSAGFDLSRGRVIVPMDGDGQNDPSDIEVLLEKLDAGYDVVSGWRKDRRDSILRVMSSKIANALISRVSGVRLHDYGCTLKAYRREVLEGVRLYGEMHRFIPIYATWLGAKVTETPVTHHPRTKGKSKYGFERILKVILDLIVVRFLSSYATKPIYVFGGFGALFLCLSIVCFIAALVFKLLPMDHAWHKDFVTTPLPVLSVGLAVVGFQIVLIGLMAEMITRTYYEAQGKSTYAIKTIRGRPSLQNDAGR